MLKEGLGDGDVALEGGGELEGQDQVELAIILLGGCRGGEGRIADMLVGSHFYELLLSIRIKIVVLRYEINRNNRGID